MGFRGETFTTDLKNIQWCTLIQPVDVMVFVVDLVQLQDEEDLEVKEEAADEGMEKSKTHIGLDVKGSKEVATAIWIATILAKFSLYQ